MIISVCEVLYNTPDTCLLDQMEMHESFLSVL